MIDTFKREIIDRYLDFTGRTNRKDFWMTILASFILGLVLGLVASFLGGLGSAITGLVGLALLIPSIAISIRRIRDTGKSPWWLLISLTGIGAIVILVFYCLDSK